MGTLTDATPRRAALWTALAVTLAALAAQAWTVQGTYGGAWTGLFCIGDRWAAGMAEAVPPSFVWPNSHGYDGQFYRVVAHDPWLQTQAWRAIDAPGLRYHRILLPAMAWLLAGGQSALIDGAYIAVVLLCLFWGTYWLSLYLAREGLPAAAGAAFLLLPGTVVCLDRMLTDIALYALLAALLLVWDGRLTWRTALILMLAPLVRDLGVLAAGAAAAHLLFRRRWWHAAGAALCVAPAWAWGLWFKARLAAEAAEGLRTSGTLGAPRWMFLESGYGLFLRMMDPLPYPGGEPALLRVTQTFDLLALGGMALAVVLAFAFWRRWLASLEGLLVLAWLALFFAASAEGLWRDTHSYPRAYTPLLGLLALEGARRRQWWWALPAVLVTLRVGWHLLPQFMFSMRWLLDSVAALRWA
jgi:hypothetical protein